MTSRLDNAMTQDELYELKAQVEAVSMQDIHLGRVLKGFLAHMADQAGLSLEPAPVAEEEAPAEEAVQALEAPAEGEANAN
jgi:hypothetical protein